VTAVVAAFEGSSQRRAAVLSLPDARPQPCSGAGMRVDEVMSEDPVWVDERANLGEAARKMIEAGVHHLPVLRAGVLVGILSDRDVRGVSPGVLDSGVPAPVLSSAGAPVADAMQREVASVTPDTDLKDVADLMIRLHIGAVPVVDPESVKLVGIVSYVDILRAARELLWG
jgi:acetoin utilization protein AcuB